MSKIVQESLDNMSHFKEGGHPYKKMKIGRYRPLRGGDILKFNQKVYIYWGNVGYPSGNTSLHLKNDIGALNKNNLFVAIDKYDERIYHNGKLFHKEEDIPSINYFEKVYTDWIINNHPYIFKIIGSINESHNFTQGGDPYKKMKIGQHREFKHGDKIILIRDIEIDTPVFNYKKRTSKIILNKGDILKYQKNPATEEDWFFRVGFQYVMIDSHWITKEYPDSWKKYIN